jgi:hypothetical protein
VVEKPYIDQLIEDFGGEFVVSTVAGIGAAFLTLMGVEWIVPSSRTNLSWECAITAVCMASYAESVILLAKATIKKESARKQLLMGTLNAYFGGLCGGEFTLILWNSGAVGRPRLLVLLIVGALSATIVFLVLAVMHRRGNSS